METTTQSEIPARAGESSLNPDTLNQLLGQMVNDLGAAVNGALIVLGDGLGIYTALADIGPATSQKLAEKTNLNERQLREWLSAQAASGYVSYDAASDSFFLTPEQTAVFADPDSPAAMIGGFYGVSAVYHDEPLVAESFRTGRGLPWGGHHNCLFCGTERFFRPGYQANISEKWIPALDGVEQKLGIGTRVADIGCGHGISTLIMAKAFPKSEFYGFDLHPASIEAANRHAQEQQIPNVRFSIDSERLPGQRLRICDGIRCPARHGRSGWCSVTCSNSPSTRWHIHDCRAPRSRLARREYQSGWQSVLWVFDDGMYSRFAQSGSWPCPWSASWRAAVERRSLEGRVYPSPPCHGNAVQHDPGSAAIGDLSGVDACTGNYLMVRASSAGANLA